MLARAALPFAVLAVATPITAAPDAAADLGRLADAFLAAQARLDTGALADLTAPDYVEISPIGEVDPRARMLSFYTPDKKRPVPPTTVAERTIRVLGDTGIVTQRLSFGPAAVRAVYIARRTTGSWKLVSLQFTPIRTPKAE